MNDDNKIHKNVTDQDLIIKAALGWLYELQGNNDADRNVDNSVDLLEYLLKVRGSK